MDLDEKHIYAGVSICLQLIAALNIFWYHSISMIVTVAILGAVMLAVLLVHKDHVLYKTSLTFFWICTVWIMVYSVVCACGGLEYLSVGHFEYCLSCLKDWMQGHMILGVCLYVVIVILHTLVIPISTTPFVLLGVAVFGPNTAFVATVVATLIGSVLTFAAGKTFGKKFVIWLIGKEKFVEYNNSIKYSGKYYLGTMFLLPVFPDDILCLMAGASDMTYREFSIIALITRPPMIAFTCYMGSGEIIPFSGWGIPVWILISLIFVGIFIGVHKYAKRKKAELSNRSNTSVAT